MASYLILDCGIPENVQEPDDFIAGPAIPISQYVSQCGETYIDIDGAEAEAAMWYALSGWHFGHDPRQLCVDLKMDLIHFGGVAFSSWSIADISGLRADDLNCSFFSRQWERRTATKEGSDTK